MHGSSCLNTSFSFQLHADQQVDNYWIRAQPSGFVRAIGFENGINSAILRYEGAPIAEPNTTLAQSTRPLVETDLHPLTDPAAVSVCAVAL